MISSSSDISSTSSSLEDIFVSCQQFKIDDRKTHNCVNPKRLNTDSTKCTETFACVYAHFPRLQRLKTLMYKNLICFEFFPFHLPLLKGLDLL